LDFEGINSCAAITLYSYYSCPTRSRSRSTASHLCSAGSYSCSAKAYSYMCCACTLRGRVLYEIGFLVAIRRHPLPNGPMFLSRESMCP
jgi:hypothetical protein